MAPVAEHGELDPGRAAVVEEGVDAGPDGAAGEEHVVDQHHGAAVDGEVEPGGVDDRLVIGCAGTDVVTVEGDVDLAEVGGDHRSARWRIAVEAVCEEDASGVDADHGQIGQTSGFFSTISWAMRRSVRSTSLASSTTFSFKPDLPGLSGP